MKTLGFVLGLALAVSVLCAQEPQQSGALRGEIRASNAMLCDDLVVELRPTTGPPVRDERADVARDGSFEFRALDPGTYSVVVRTLSGTVLQQQIVDIAPRVQPLVIELAQPKEQRPASGPVSVTRLLHPPPRRAVQMTIRAKHLSDQGQPEKAADELEKAVRIAPEFADARNNLGVQYVALGRDEDALAQFQAAVLIAPGMSLAHSNLAWALWKLGRLTDAEVAVRQAVALDPANLRAHLILGSLLSAQVQHREEAVRELNLAAPEMPNALLRLAGLYASAGEPGKAEEAMRQYHELSANRQGSGRR